MLFENPHESIKNKIDTIRNTNPASTANTEIQSETDIKVQAHIEDTRKEPDTQTTPETSNQSPSNHSATFEDQPIDGRRDPELFSEQPLQLDGGDGKAEEEGATEPDHLINESDTDPAESLDGETDSTTETNDKSARADEQVRTSGGNENEETFWLPDESAHDTAMRSQEVGLSVIAIGAGNKVPRGGWKEFQRRRATLEEVKEWRDCGAYAIVCGAISGHIDADGQQLYLTVLDFDVATHYDKFIALVGDKVAHLPLVKTGGGGYHIYFLSTEPLRSEKLAHVPNETEESGRKTASETRGEGSFVVGPNSRHESGNYYILLQGDLAHIPVISSELVKELFDAARSLDEAPFTRQQLEQQAKREEKARPKSHKEAKSQSWPKTQKVIEGFNAAHTVHEQLLKHGYTPVPRTDRYARPGGRNPTVAILGGERSFHHSANDELHGPHPYSAFDLFCHFEHGGEFKEALKAAAAELGIELGLSEEERRAARRLQIAEMAGAKDLPLMEVGNRQLGAMVDDLSDAFAIYNRKDQRLFRGAQGMLEIDLVRAMRRGKGPEQEGKDAPGASPEAAAYEDEGENVDEVTKRWGVPGEDRAQMREVTRARLQVIASRAAYWFKNGARGILEVAPDAELMDNFLASPADWRAIPYLDWIAHAPFFDARGNLVAKSGYHAPSRTFVQLPADLDLGDTTPSPENVAAALKLLLNDLLGEVAFADQPSRAHALALMILPFVRQLIWGPTPLHLGNGPTVSSGKTYALAVCVAPFTRPILTTEKGNEEEWRKALVAKLLAAPSHLFFDNVKHNLNSPTLDAAITAPDGLMEDRLLGSSTNVRFPTGCVWVASANNARITEDVASRSILIDIDTDMEDPSQRKFKGNPLAYISAHRGQVCGAIITLVRAWQQAGCPNYSGPHQTRFPEWQCVIGGILQTIGIEGFLGNLSGGRGRIISGDNEAWAELVRIWFNQFGTSPKTGSELYPLVANVATLAGSLGAGSDAAKERSWGQKLAKMLNRRVGGYKIVAGPKVERRSTYKLVPPSSSPPQDTTSPGPTPEDCPPTSPESGDVGGQGAKIEASRILDADSYLAEGEAASDWRPYFEQVWEELQLREDEPLRYSLHWPEAGPLPRFCDAYPRARFPAFYEHYDRLFAQARQRLDAIADEGDNGPANLANRANQMNARSAMPIAGEPTIEDVVRGEVATTVDFSGELNGCAGGVPANSVKWVEKARRTGGLGDFQRGSEELLVGGGVAGIRAELDRVVEHLNDWDAYFLQQFVGNRVPRLRENEPDQTPANWPHALPMPRATDLWPRQEYPHYYEYYDDLKAWHEQLRQCLDAIESGATGDGSVESNVGDSSRV